MNKHKVYVYGTLRPNSGTTCLIPGTIHDLGWYPGLALKAPDCGSFVVAEIIEATDEELRGLDAYEGYDENNLQNSLYLRIPYLGGFVYVYNGDMSTRPVVDGGDWLKYRGEAKGVSANRFVKEEVRPTLDDDWFDGADAFIGDKPVKNIANASSGVCDDVGAI